MLNLLSAEGVVYGSQLGLDRMLRLFSYYYIMSFISLNEWVCVRSIL